MFDSSERGEFFEKIQVKQGEQKWTILEVSILHYNIDAFWKNGSGGPFT